MYFRIVHISNKVKERFFLHISGTATYSEQVDSSSDSDEEEVPDEPVARLEPEPPTYSQPSPELVNSLHRNAAFGLSNSEDVLFSPEFVEPIHERPFVGVRDRSPSPVHPPSIIVSSAPTLTPPVTPPHVTGNGFSLPEFENRTILSEHVKVEDVKNNCVLNGRRTSRDISPVPVPIKPEVPVKIEHPEPVLSKEDLRCVFIRNQNMRHLIFKEVKRPGKDHGKLFEMLRDLHGPPSVRRSYIHDVIVEARRFKRETLVHKLEQAMDDLISVS